MNNPKRAKYGEPIRFLHEVILPYKGNECFIWPFGRAGTGYAQIRYNEKACNVHRIVCELTYGAPPTPKHEAAHSCGRGCDGCVSPVHLRWATKAENMKEVVTHGHSNRGSLRWIAARGEKQGSSKLTEPDVRAILSMKGRVSQPKLAIQFGVAQSTIWAILNGKTWSWLS